MGTFRVRPPATQSPVVRITSLSGNRARRRQQLEQARIELMKRVSQVRILPGRREKGRLRRGFLPGRPFVVSGVVLHACHYVESDGVLAECLASRPANSRTVRLIPTPHSVHSTR